ncbi:penicillin-binding protein 2 [Mycobacterium simiae]|uniref:Penicillin-binding protein PbpB n=1 Tax=Mycobacterium simiae TaxID=1784 RepID=A0A5B1BQQ1_MYCSI|nr:penicillin-binding protein 2 [Mycobacterium simiae]
MSRDEPRRPRPAAPRRPRRAAAKPSGAPQSQQPARPGKRAQRRGTDATEPKRSGNAKDPAKASHTAPAPAIPPGRSARERRTRQAVQVATRGASFVFRHRAGNAVIFTLMIVAATQLFFLQVSSAAELRAQAAGQLKVTDVEPALRGAIVDRHNDRLAFTIEARALTFQPKRVRQQLEEAKKKSPAAPDPQQRIKDLATEIAGKLNNKPDAATLLKKLQSNESFVYLARAVDPVVATAICAKYPEVGSERQDLRQYPGGSLAANIVGGIDWDGHGLLGLEDSLDAALGGTDGSVTYDRGSDGVVIPGSYRNRHKAVHGSTVQLTLDNDIQFYVQQQVQQAKNLSGARNVSAVVLDATTGEVLAMANDNTFDPSQDIGRQSDKQLGNLAVSSPFEPGSVNKVITASSVIEYGLSNPAEVLQVPGTIQMGGVSVHDAWEHGVMPYTTTGVFGKSSNVGTLMLAQRVGPERFYDMVRKFGLGQRTGVGLPGESAGLVPPIDQWSGSTFSNLPIGQGLSMTLLQMTGMYQAIANDGVRIPPRIIKATISADGTRTEEPRPEGVRVVSAQTAQTVRQILRAVVQQDPMGYQQGTGPAAAVPGYQMAGKTGTAQQINPGCGCYFDNVYWITFAGLATVDNPRYVIGLMMDNPERNADGSPGHSAAPLFHNIAGWLMQRENVPLSPDPGPPLVLQAT